MEFGGFIVCPPVKNQDFLVNFPSILVINKTWKSIHR